MNRCCLRNGEANGERRFMDEKLNSALSTRSPFFNTNCVDKTNNICKINILSLIAGARVHTLRSHSFAHRRCHRDKNKCDRIKENDRERRGARARDRERENKETEKMKLVTQRHAVLHNYAMPN